MSEESLSNRKKRFLEDCCGAAPAMSGGDAMYTSDSPAGGPTAGFDPMLGKRKKKGIVDTAKRLKRG